jgi:hypothetical protein
VAAAAAGDERDPGPVAAEDAVVEVNTVNVGNRHGDSLLQA